jgi:hypothetical protein
MHGYRSTKQIRNLVSGLLTDGIHTAINGGELDEYELMNLQVKDFRRVTQSLKTK